MQVRALRLQLRLNNLLCVVPCTAGVCHENRLIQTEQRNRNKIADKEVGFHERKPQSSEEYRKEDVQHPFLRVLRADLNNALRITDRSSRHRIVSSNVRLD